MVQNVMQRTKVQVKAPRRGLQPRPGNLYLYRLLSDGLGERTLGRYLSLANNPPVGAFPTLPCHNGRKSGIRFETVDLAILINPVPGEGDTLTGFPAAIRAQGPISSSVHSSDHLLL
jgi:hypothetical protein